MSELWRQSLALVADAVPGALYTHNGAVRANTASMERRAVSTFDTEDAFRLRNEGTPIFNAWNLRWVNEWEPTSQRIFAEALADQPATAGPPDIYRIRHGQASPRRHRFEGLLAVDSVNVALHGAVLTEWQLIVDKGILRNETTWAALRSEIPYTGTAPVPLAPYAATTQCTAQLTLNATPATCHTVAISFTRNLTAGQFDEDGRANEWAGKSAVEITGRATLRMAAADYYPAANTTWQASLALAVGTSVISLPTIKATLRTRRLIEEGLFEHEVEFIALNTASGLAIITLPA